MQQAVKGEKWANGVSWLMRQDNPSIRYWTMKDLLGYSQDDSELSKARSEIADSSLVSLILSEQRPGGYWAEAEDSYWPKWQATVWNLMLLAELGVPSDHPQIKKGCEFFLKTMDEQDRSWPAPDYPEGDLRGYRLVWEPCVTGNMARTLIQFGYQDDPRVGEMFEWLVRTQFKDGGWNCDEADRSKQVKHSSFMSTIEPLWAFSALDPSRWPKRGRETVDRGCEFLLMHRLYKSDKTFQTINEEWTKLHFPLFYFYDILHGLRVLTALESAHDKRTFDALELLKTKHSKDGTWPLEATYTRAIKGNLVKDYGTGEWKRVKGEGVAKVPQVYGELGSIGEPNPWITLNALRVLSHQE